MKFNDSILKQVYAEMHEALGEIGDIVIAGGAVRDTLMGRTPKDYDVFILNSGENYGSFTEVKNEVGVRLANHPKVDIKFEWHKSEPFLIESIKTKHGEVQIMARNIQTEQDLMDTFDWNVALFTFGKNGYICRESVENIGEGKDLVLHKVTYPYSTLRRGYRFSERFTMKLRRQDTLKLCEMIVQNSKKSTEEI